MQKLKLEIKELDKPAEEREEGENRGEYLVKYDAESGEFYVKHNKQKVKLTLGDIIADYAWGIKYVPDKNMPEKLYYRLKKRIETNEARRDIEKIHNQELIKTEHLPDYAKKFRQEGHQAGKLAEKMVCELMTRLQFLPGMEFQIQRATVEEDIVKKYDFKILIRQHKRGVRMEGGEAEEITSKKLAIQFTISHNKNKLREKRRQLREIREEIAENSDVDDIVLVRVDLNQAQEIFDRWMAMGRPPGGPEKLIDSGHKKEIFQGITQGMAEMPDEELEKIFASS